MSLVFTGDIMLGRNILPYVRKKGGVAKMLSAIKHLTQNNVVIANLECPLTNRNIC